MLLTKWIEKVGKAVISDSDDQPILISAVSPMHLQAWLAAVYDPKRHQAALLVRNTNSDFALYLDTPSDIPFKDVKDPNCLNSYLIKYSSETPEKCIIRIE